MAAVLEAFAAAPADQNVQLYVMDLLMKSGDYKAAVAVGEKIEAMRQPLPKSSPDSTCEQWLGRAYTELGRIDDAIAVYRRVLAAAGPGSDLHIGLLHSTGDLLAKGRGSRPRRSACAKTACG